MKPGDREYSEAVAATRAMTELAAGAQRLGAELAAVVQGLEAELAAMVGTEAIEQLNAWDKELSKAFESGDSERVMALFKQAGEPIDDNESDSGPLR